MTDAIVATLSVGGFICLMLAMPRHHADWLRRKSNRVDERTWRVAGFAALLSSFALLVASSGWAYGAVAWAGWLTLAAVIVVAANVNRERISRSAKKAKP